MANCPICNGEFGATNVAGVTVARCDRCDGLFLGAGDLDRIAQRPLEEQLHRWAGDAAQCRYCQSPVGLDGTCMRCGKVPTIGCPRGHGTMQVTLVDLGGQEFEIDLCRTCRGLWIDGHEREKVEAADPHPVHHLDYRPVTGRSYERPRSSLFSEEMQDAHRTAYRALPMLMAIAPDYHVVAWFNLNDPRRSDPRLLVVMILVGIALLAAAYHFAAPLLAAF